MLIKTVLLVKKNFHKHSYYSCYSVKTFASRSSSYFAGTLNMPIRT